MRWMILVMMLTSACGAAQSSTPAMSGPADGLRFAEVADSRSISDDNGGSPSATPQHGMKKIRNASMTVVVRKEKHIVEAVERTAKLADLLEGYVADKSESSITLKIPNGRLDEALAAVAELGKVKSRDVRTVDVTARYVDLEIRLQNLEKMRQKFEDLLGRAESVQDALAVEKELSRVTTELEALKGQMRVLENQTTFATLRVHYQEKVSPGPVGWVFYGLYSGVKWLFVWD